MNAAARYGLSRIHRLWTMRLLGAISITLVLLFFMVFPERQRGALVRNDVERLRSTFADMQKDPLFADQEEQIQQVEYAYDHLLKRSKELRRRFNVLPTMDESSAEARIDFKVALQEARERIHQEAIAKGYQYPETLGMTETIAAEESTETRIRQLQAGVRVAELCFETNIAHLESLRPLLPAARYNAASSNDFWAVDYRTEVAIVCDYGHLISFLDALRKTTQYFSIYSISVSHPGPETPDQLEVRLVIGVGRIQDKGPGERAAGTPALEKNDFLPNEDPT